jgi:hypothetical protein
MGDKQNTNKASLEVLYTCQLDCGPHSNSVWNPGGQAQVLLGNNSRQGRHFPHPAPFLSTTSLQGCLTRLSNPKTLWRETLKGWISRQMYKTASHNGMTSQGRRIWNPERQVWLLFCPLQPLISPNLSSLCNTGVMPGGTPIGWHTGTSTGARWPGRISYTTSQLSSASVFSPIP